MQREYPRAPLCGVGALIINEDRVLLVKRGSEPGIGTWSIPGGLVEVGEHLEDAVKREVFEETGLIVNPTDLVVLVERIFKDENGRVKYHYIIADYLCPVSEGDLKAGSDAWEVIWAKQGDLERYHLPCITIEAINKAFEMELS